LDLEREESFFPERAKNAKLISIEANMKLCPKCGQQFTDENLRFCLMDGELLFADPSSTSEPTVFIPPTGPVNVTAAPPPKKKSKTFLWVVLGLLVLAMGTAVLIAVAFVAYRIGNEHARSNGTVANHASTPISKPSASPTATATSSASPDDETDEVIPILWTTSAVQFKPDVGNTYKFDCPKNGTASIVWGSDVYTADSSVCTAAVHAGKITLDAGGEVTIEMRPGRAAYGGTLRNGITSQTYGGYPNSFVFK